MMLDNENEPLQDKTETRVGKRKRPEHIFTEIGELATRHKFRINCLITCRKFLTNTYGIITILIKAA
jgi:hypothetical protein